jgi:Uma2 family endonuclease
MSVAPQWEESIELPRAIRFPIEMIPPAGFDPEDPGTWPRVDGRLEFVDGRLWYMPLCGQDQQQTVTDVVTTLGLWSRAHAGFVVGTNEAGMRLVGSTRGADAAVWSRSALGPSSTSLPRVAPILVVEVAGRDDTEEYLREKAGWYLGAGVQVVWLVLPETRTVLVLAPGTETRFAADAQLPEHPALPGLAPRVRELFLQLDGG